LRHLATAELGMPGRWEFSGAETSMFDRLTEQALAVVVATHAEAAELGHGWIGTEHLVLGLARLEDHEQAVGPRLLLELGPGEQAVRDHVLKRLPPTRRRGDHQLLDESPYPSALRLVLERSSQAALRQGPGHVGSEHLLIGLLEESSCAGARLLAELGITLDKVLRQRDRGGRRGGGAGAGPEAPPGGPCEPTVAMTAPAVPVLELARQQAVQDGSGGRVGTQHYLLGLLAQPDTVAAKLLSSLGVDYTLAKARLMEFGEEEPLEPPRPAPVRAPSNTKRVEVPNDDRFEALVGEVARLLPAGAPLGFNSDGEIAWIVTSGNVDLAALVEQARARIVPSA
jgi:ATP-dependent Clp protease ATP-binding subunit ClpA